MSVDELINLDKNNFVLLYEEIFKIHIDNSVLSINGARTGKLIIEGKKKEQYDISVNQKYADCENIVKSLLGSKIDYFE
jgi:hypothetical protein